jgi:hypothetical protein
MAEGSSNIILGILVVGFIVLGGLVAYTYFKPSESITNIQGATTDINVKVAQLAATIDQINSTTGTINKMLQEMASSNKKYMDSNSVTMATLSKQVSDLTAANASLATKADLTAANDSLATKADLTTANASLATKADLTTANAKITEISTILSNMVIDSKSFFDSNIKSNTQLSSLLNSIKSIVFTKEDFGEIVSKLNVKLAQLSDKTNLLQDTGPTGNFTQYDDYSTDHIGYVAYAVTGIHSKMLINAQQYLIKLLGISEYLNKVMEETEPDQRVSLVKKRVDVMISYLKKYIHKLRKLPQVA